MPESQARLMDDAALVKQAQTGDAEAFGCLYDRYATGIYRFLFVQLPDHYEAEDLTSEVFIKAWRSLPRYRERGYPFSTYLFKIARNALIDYWRKEKHKATHSEDRLVSIADGSSNPGDQLVQMDELEEIRMALGKLRVDYRSVLVLRFINGFSSRETANIMRRSEGAVRVLQHRALKAIRERLK